ncbi:MAG TPA: sulfatase-like hydrolase/transferase [Candidatus Baltobacteraceae bacterium]|nr:sulfatase-like hydrolase/transferase [Candidatus Baltobacteraceae bacterium]
MKSLRFNFCGAFAALIALEFSAVAQTIAFSNSPVQAIPRRSSIILIVANGLGYGDLSCYGQTKFQTPNLDKLAAGGVRFTNYFGEADAAKSQAELMSGKNSGLGELTVAQVLKNSGYHTGFIGEWDLGGENSGNAPWRRGFEEFAGYFDENDAKNFYADYVFRYAPNSIYDETNKTFGTYIGREPLVPNRDGAKKEFIPDVLTKAACNFAKINQPDAANHYRPFFLVLNCKIPGDGSGRAPSDAPYSNESWPQAEKNKAALISRLDGYVGQIRDQLTKLGMTNNVAIFFTSDSISPKANGVDPNFFHSNISPTDLRVPMIVCCPEKFSGGHISNFKWSAKDFLPTAAEIGYVKSLPKGIDGTSIWSTNSQQILK